MSDVWEDSDQVENRVSSKKTTTGQPISLQELLKLQASNSAEHVEVELCYTGRKAFIKPLKVNDKKELLKAIENKNETLVNRLLDNIIEKYVEIPGYEHDLRSLIQQERHQLLAYIRVANGDKVVKLGHQCPQCEHVERNIEFNLDELYVKNCTLSEEDLIVEWNISNSDSENYIHIQVGPLNRFEDKSVESYLKREKITAKTETQLVYLAASVKRVEVVQNGSSQEVQFKNLDEKVQWYQSIPNAIDTKVKNVVEKLDFGVRLPFDFKCSKCGYKNLEDANIAVFFIS